MWVLLGKHRAENLIFPFKEPILINSLKNLYFFEIFSYKYPHLDSHVGIFPKSTHFLDSHTELFPKSTHFLASHVAFS
jgi:hypothetical protein